MVITRRQAMTNISVQGVMEKLSDNPVKGNERKHYVYFAKGKALVLVSLRKRNKWGLIMIDECGKMHKGQYVKHRIHPHESGFDGTYFYWSGYIDNLFANGKSIPPYFSVVEPVQWTDGWGFDPKTGKPSCDNGWGRGGAHGIMWDLTNIKFQPLPPPADYGCIT
jgi:hypothetical protein